MLFNFRLTPLEQVSPWGSEGELSLHWFGLSDGCYWLRAGDVELYRVSQTFLRILDSKSHCNPYVDYFIARLWEDLLEILPTVLTLVPKPLQEKLLAANMKAWWHGKIFHWYDTHEDISLEFDINATEWLRKRLLPGGYLKHDPYIWLWSDETHVHVEWDSRDIVEQDVPVWDTQLGSWSLPVEMFLSEIHSFHTAFMNVMQARVDQVLANWARTEIHIDREGLIRAQTERQIRLGEVLRVFQNW